MPDAPTGDLLERFVQGDRAAFETLFRQFQAEVFGWAFRIVRNREAAEDVVVEAFWRAYRGRARFDASRSFGAWMRRIASNAALDSLRSTRSRPGTSAIRNDVPAPDAPDPHVAESVARAFRALPPKLRIVATLALLEEMPHAEIADALDLPLGTVKSRLFRATRSLRAGLARRGVGP